MRLHIPTLAGATHVVEVDLSGARSVLNEAARVLYAAGFDPVVSDFGDHTPMDRAEPTNGDDSAMKNPGSEPGLQRAMVRDSVTTPAMRPAPTLGADVIYRSRTGDYSLAAKVARNCHSSSPEALQRGREAGRLFMVPLSLYEADLTVFTPGGSYIEGQPSQWTGTYAEHQIGYDPDGAPGTWRYFADAVQRGVPL